MLADLSMSENGWDLSSRGGSPIRGVSPIRGSPKPHHALATSQVHPTPFSISSVGGCPVFVWESRKVDVRLPGKGNSNPHGARPVHLINHDEKVDSDQ